MIQIIDCEPFTASVDDFTMEHKIRNIEEIKNNVEINDYICKGYELLHIIIAEYKDEYMADRIVEHIEVDLLLKVEKDEVFFYFNFHVPEIKKEIKTYEL